MKNGIVKIWVCSACQKEYLDRPLMCTKCKKLEFEVKYGGQISDAEELSKLVYAYREKDYQESLKAFTKSSGGKDKSAKGSGDGSDKDKKPGNEEKPDINKRTRM